MVCNTDAKSDVCGAEFPFAINGQSSKGYLPSINYTFILIHIPSGGLSRFNTRYIRRVEEHLYSWGSLLFLFCSLLPK